MTKVSEIFEFIDSFAPFETAMTFDNVGILVGNIHAKVERCVVALDVTQNVIDEAKILNASLIISHHPVIFSPIKTLSINSVPYILAKNDLTVICAHTNLDMASFGVNSCLAEALCLQNLTPLSWCESKKGPLPMGLVGVLNSDFSCEEFAKFVKMRLNCYGVRYTDSGGKIRKIAVCSGAGGDLINEAISQNVDAFVTGEIKHHEILVAVQNEICVVDTGHFNSENVIVLPLVEKLADKFPEVEFFCSKTCVDAVKYMV